MAVSAVAPDVDRADDGTNTERNAETQRQDGDEASELGDRRVHQCTVYPKVDTAADRMITEATRAIERLVKS